MKLLSALLALVCSVFVYGQNNSLLYSIKGPDGKTSYLYGTMHIVPDSLFYFPPKLQKTLDKTDELILEIGELDQSKMKLTLELKSGSCFDIFTPEQKDSVIAWGAKEMNVSEEVFEKGFTKKKPFALMQISSQKMMKGNVKMVEYEIIGRSHNKPRSGFETMEDQLGIFDSLPDHQMANMIMSTIRDTASSDSLFQAMLVAYQHRNIDELSELFSMEESTDFPVDQLLVNRNKKWIPIIEEKIKDHSCFIAVGAGHLGGEFGVIKLLQNAGYEVKPIQY